MEDIDEHYVSFAALATPASSPESTASDPLLAFKATADPDTMYMHEALKQPDRAKFIQAMLDEVENQRKNGNWVMIHRSKVPQGELILPGVWAMKRKRRIATQEIYRWKARLNLDGSKQIQGKHFDETYAPVASWPIIRLLLSFAISQGWHSKQLDYVLAYPQADISHNNVYMQIPKGFEVPGADPKEYVLHIRKNVYGGRNAGKTWNDWLVERLIKAGFAQSAVDPCVFTHGNAFYLVYTDDSILCGPEQQELEDIVARIKGVGLNITDDGDVGDFLGVDIQKQADGTVHMTQPQLIASILSDLRMDGPTVATKETPAKVNALLRRGTPESPNFNGAFHYRGVIGKLNYLATTRMDIAYAVNQCARFSSDPKEHHGHAVRWIGRYLAGTKDKGIIFRPKSESFQVYVDADFSGNWSQDTAEWDPDTARSRSGFIITYAGCPVYWASRLQTEIALSTTEAEVIAASESMRHVIHMMDLIDEFKSRGFPVFANAPNVHTRLYEDNSGAIEIMKVPKVRSRTKHLNVKYHHYREAVRKQRIKIFKIESECQPSDMLTKSLSPPLFLKHRNYMMGW